MIVAIFKIASASAMNGTQKLASVLWRRPRPTPGCSAVWKEGRKRGRICHE
jgi:hypothetical protein